MTDVDAGYGGVIPLCHAHAVNQHDYKPPCSRLRLTAMYTVQMMTFAEIARTLGVSVHAIQTAMRRFGIHARRATPRNQWGANNGSWKGSAAGYKALHLRVSARRGQPRCCEVCGTKKAKRYEWANLSGRYDDPGDYKRMCKSCHAIHDRIIANITKAT